MNLSSAGKGSGIRGRALHTRLTGVSIGRTGSHVLENRRRLFVLRNNFTTPCRFSAGKGDPCRGPAFEKGEDARNGGGHANRLAADDADDAGWRKAVWGTPYHAGGRLAVGAGRFFFPYGEAIPTVRSGCPRKPGHPSRGRQPRGRIASVRRCMFYGNRIEARPVLWSRLPFAAGFGWPFWVCPVASSCPARRWRCPQTCPAAGTSGSREGRRNAKSNVSRRIKGIRGRKGWRGNVPRPICPEESCFRALDKRIVNGNEYRIQERRMARSGMRAHHTKTKGDSYVPDQ